MSETALTKKIKQACVAFRPEMPTQMRTIRYAYEVKSPESGIIDVVRFEDYISNNKSYCKRFVSNCLSELDKIILRDGVGECKIKGEQYPNKNCSGCVWYSHVYELDMMTTCFEVKISVSDFKSKNGHNFYGNKNYYAVDSRIYKEIESLVPEDIGILVYYESSGQMRCKRESKFKEISNEDKIILLYNAMKKWCDGKMNTPID